MLPPSSNIVKFQKQFYVYPTAGSERFLWNFVFNEMYSSINKQTFYIADFRAYMILFRTHHPCLLIIDIRLFSN
ncbi:hypothetical protein [Paenibacillus lactis]|uniref:hypothetical protein n=1 Tax=Paenibacillus TaxID=44249 RepID=UPI001427D09B